MSQKEKSTTAFDRGRNRGITRSSGSEPLREKQDHKSGPRTQANSFYVVCGTSVVSAQTLEVSIRSRNDAPSRKGCVVNGQMIKTSN